MLATVSVDVACDDSAPLAFHRSPLTESLTSASNAPGFREFRCRWPKGRCTAGFLTGLCPLWVISGQSVILEPCPLYPQKRTNRRRLDLSALCQKRTHAPQQKYRYSITLSARSTRLAGTS